MLISFSISSFKVEFVLSGQLTSKKTDFILYKSQEGNISLQMLVQDETFWITQKQMAEVFEVEVNTINSESSEMCSE